MTCFEKPIEVEMITRMDTEGLCPHCKGTGFLRILPKKKKPLDREDISTAGLTGAAFGFVGGMAFTGAFWMSLLVAMTCWVIGIVAATVFNNRMAS